MPTIPLPLTVELARTAPADVDATAVGVTKEGLDGDGGDWSFLRAQGFEAKRGEVRVVPGEDDRPVYAVGLGAAGDLDAGTICHAAGALARAAKRQASLAVDMSAAGDRVDAARTARALVEGLALGGYEYTAFKSKPSPARLARVVLVGGGGKRVQAAVDRALVVSEAVRFARDLVNEPGGSLTPTELADRAVAAGKDAGFKVTVWDEEAVPRGAPRRPARREPGVGPARSLPAAPLRAAGGEGHGRAGRQGHHVRLRRPVDQDDRRDGRHEGRHGRRRRGAGDVPCGGATSAPRCASSASCR